MPPKSSASSQSTDNVTPVPLDDIVHDLRSPDERFKQRSVIVLSTVAFQPAVKEYLFSQGETFCAPLAKMCLERTQSANACRWETLSIIGELCRREHKADVGNDADTLNDLSSKFAALFCGIPWFKGALEDLERDDSVPDVAAMAGDLLRALPFGGAWTKEMREACKDLMFLDTCADRRGPLPMVCRGLSHQCAQCKAVKDELLQRCARCKSVFYCSPECQKAHWTVAHKVPCGACAKGDPTAIQVLCYPTRGMLFAARPDALRSVGFSEYFMDFTPGKPTP